MGRVITASMVHNELKLSTARSGGPGGQNVNKLNTKVVLHFDVANSESLTEEEKLTILAKLATKITTEGVLVVSSQEKRSQLENKEMVLRKFDLLMKKAFRQQKPRKATKPSKASQQNRIEKKKRHSEKKSWRKKIE